MNKDEIMEKSRAENGMVDERERIEQGRSNSIVLTVVMVAWALLLIWDVSHGKFSSELQGLILLVPSTIAFLNFRSTRSKEALLLGALGGAGALIFIAQHILDTM